MFFSRRKTGEGEIEYAGINARVTACLIDTMLFATILLPLAPVMEWLAQRVYAIAGITPDLQGFAAAVQPQMSLAQLVDAIVANGILDKMIADAFISMALFGLIVIPFWRYKSATPGKILLRMKVVDAETLEEPSQIQSVLRFLGYLLSSVLLLGFIWVAFDRRKQGWHDKIAGTVVIFDPKRKRLKSLLPEPGQIWRKSLDIYKEMKGKPEDK